MTSASLTRFRISRFVFGFLSLAGLLGLLLPIPTFGRPGQPIHHKIRIEASSFAFDPEIVWVNPGDLVTIELVSTDVVHGIYLDGYDLQVSADPGQARNLTFTANRPGTFRFRCSVTCGPMHPFMIGKLNVGPNHFLWRGVSLAVFATFALIGLVRYETT